MSEKSNLLGTKLLIFLDKNQEEQAHIDFHSSTQVYNHFLTLNKRYYRRYKKGISYNRQSKHLSKLLKLSKHMNWDQSSRTCLTISLQNLNTAFSRFFKDLKSNKAKSLKSGFPKYKKKTKYSTSYQSNTIGKGKDREPHALIKENGEYFIHIPNIKNVKIHTNKFLLKYIERIKSQPKMMSLSYNCGNYYVSFNVEKEYNKHERSNNINGIDLNIGDIVCSSGKRYAMPRAFKKNQGKLRYYQKKIARQKKTRIEEKSNRQKKTELRIARTHKRIEDIRLDFAHKTTDDIVKNNGFIGAEDLNVKGMVKNRRLSKAISDSSWGMILSMLEYKCAKHGRIFQQVGKYFASSKICSECGYKNEDLRLKDREWTCPICGKRHDRDENAAKNIEKEAVRIYLDGHQGEIKNMEMMSDTRERAIINEMFIRKVATGGHVGNVAEGGC